ncbi:hypothetical protein K469DRAFT_720289 [Zopfia rhizophila CBS 207.26]|uniref:Cora-domain-containing protein n=1 Tax=Zopfia rhizophila CBS 207.26 TaxID=1314779 RepID=A0A6A6EKQ3_9PEZI|nr:hypothetical protein K469DRAFT_720289 [Zopfia rhizophila CBS 207.26]
MVLASILEFSPSTGKWHSRKAELEVPLNRVSPFPCYIFLTKSVYPKREAERRELLRHFNIPRMIATDMCNQCNGYFGSKEVYNETDQTQSYNTWLRCLVKISHHTPQGGTGYTWYEMTFFTHWEPNRCMAVCVDIPDNFLTDLEHALSTESAVLDLSDPFTLHIPLMDQIIMLYDQSVWRIRDLIRRVEKNREKDQAADADFSELHEISRHSTHSSETLSVTIQTMEDLQQRHREFHEHSLSPIAVTSTGWKATQQYMGFQAQLIRNLKLRSQANQERLLNEITLAYNTITQRDSKVMVEIGEATQSDSAAMKTVAVVTITFLPATFTSAIFSMSFFNFSPGDGSQADEWRVSGKIWIYWVVAVPLTGLALFSWFLWQRSKGQSLQIHNLWRRQFDRQRLKQDEKA